jgi:hypothetical protein
VMSRHDAISDRFASHMEENRLATRGLHQTQALGYG